MSELHDQLSMLMLRTNTVKSAGRVRGDQARRSVARLAKIERASDGNRSEFRNNFIGAPRLYEKRKLIAQSGLFSCDYYLSHAGLTSKYLNPIDHYLLHFPETGADPHPLFDGKWYLNQNPDVEQARVNPLLHYLRFGAREGRNPHPLFDAILYLRLYPDVAASGMNPLVHYVKYGGLEGRRPHWLFDGAAYLKEFPELVELKMTPLEHYCRYGALVSFRPHQCFDPDFYLGRHPHVLAEGMNPLLHFLKTRTSELQDPSSEFTVEAYWQLCPNAKPAGENPLIHFANWAESGPTALVPTVPESMCRPPVMADSVSAGLLPVPSDAEAPTQRLQDFLYDEFGLGERSLIVAGMQHFRLPLSGGQVQNSMNDEELARLAGVVSSLAELLPEHGTPDVSIIVPVYNQVRFTLACLYSILASKVKWSFELIIADDCSNDATSEVFAQGLRHIRHVRSASNVGFLRNCNNAARSAKGRVLVFLNNDTYVLPGWLDYLVETLDDNPEIGLVGSKLIFSDGRLQESGGFVFSDSSGWNYGRLDDPRKTQYSYLRDTDYVSGASIAITRSLWEGLGGFDERYEKAYYEDTDLAFRVRQVGRRVVVQPLSQLIHFEGISSGTDLTTGVKRYQVVNGKIFLQRWTEILSGYGIADSKNLPVHRTSKGTILVIDARTPTPDRDSGSMDTYQYLRILKSFGFHVVFLPQNLAHAGRYTAELQRFGVEALYAPYWMSFEQILADLGSTLKYVLIYRAPVAEEVYDQVRRFAPQAKVIFDTVDLHFLRLEREATLAGDERRSQEASCMKQIELEMVRKADATIVLSRYELDVLKELTPGASLFEIPIVRQVPAPREKGFDQRRDLVFVGGFEHAPNIDAVKWFVAEVLPRLQDQGFKGQFVVVGSNMPPEIKALAQPGVNIRGYVADLEELFSNVRLSIAPLRYGAGLKGKVISSLSYGVPVVATTVAVEGTGLCNNVHVAVADHPEALVKTIVDIYENRQRWEDLSSAGYQYFRKHFSVEAVACKLEELFKALGHH